MAPLEPPGFSRGEVQEPDITSRFSVHGIPVFVVFRGTQSLGRITSWPGVEHFIAAIERQRALAWK